MKNKKQKYIIIVILILFILSYILLFYKIFSPKSTECSLLTKNDSYQKENIVLIKYKNTKVSKIIQKEIFVSKNKELMEIKKVELQKGKYKVSVSKDKVKGTKSIESKEEYKFVLHDLLDAGYSCKQ